MIKLGFLSYYPKNKWLWDLPLQKELKLDSPFSASDIKNPSEIIVPVKKITVYVDSKVIELLKITVGKKKEYAKEPMSISIGEKNYPTTFGAIIEFESVMDGFCRKEFQDTFVKFLNNENQYEPVRGVVSIQLWKLDTNSYYMC